MAKETQTQIEYSRYITKKLSELSERIRALEGKMDILKQKIDVVDRNLIDKTRDLKDEVGKLEHTTRRLKSDMLEVQDAIKHIMLELKDTAKKREVAVLSKYLDYLDPTRFLSKEDVIKIVKELKEKGDV